MRLGFRVCVAVLIASSLPAWLAHGEPQPSDALPSRGDREQAVETGRGDREQAVESDRSGSFEEIGEQLRGEPFTVRADSLHYDMERELYVADGHVEIEQTGRRLRADWAAFNRRTGAGVASGSVELVQGGDVLRADFVEFELEVLEGRIQGGSFASESSPFRASAAEIEKLGEDRYAFRDGRFTTCRCEDEDRPVPWAIAAERAELEVEGYATARNARFEVFGVPIAWVPWAVFPVKTERQTGFLFPELSFGSVDGFELGLPFFWAIREEVGLVLTPRYSTDWGFGGAAAFDYAAGPDSEGKLLAGYVHDQEIDPGSPDEPYPRDRWSASGAHHLAGPGALHLRADHRMASDNDIPFDFAELSEHRNDRFLESRAELARGLGPLEQAGVSVGGRFVDDLQSPDDLDRDRFLLQRWPEVRGDLAPTALGVSWLAPSLDVGYVRFDARRSAFRELPGAVPSGPGGIFLDTGVDALPSVTEPGFALAPDPHGDDFATTGGSEGDGIFQEGEPLTDRGHRLLVHPRLALPLDAHGVQLVPEVGWHQTFYDSDLRGSRERGFLTVRADLSTRLRRDFGAVSHVLEPQLGYALAATGSQRRNTLFVPATAAPQGRLRALDLDAVTRDDADRIERANRLSFGAGNRVYGEGGALRAEFRLLGLYEFEGDAFDAVILDGRAFPTSGVDLRYHADFDPERGRLDEGLAGARWTLPAGLTLEGAYRWNRDLPLFFEDFANGDRFDEDRGDMDHIHQIEGGFAVDLTRRWALRYRLAYAIEGQRLLANRGALEYFSACGCWSAALEVTEDRTRGVDAALVVRLLGLGGDWAPRGPGLLDALRALW